MAEGAQKRLQSELDKFQGVQKGESRRLNK